MPGALRTFSRCGDQRRAPAVLRFRRFVGDLLMGTPSQPRRNSPELPHDQQAARSWKAAKPEAIDQPASGRP